MHCLNICETLNSVLASCPTVSGSEVIECSNTWPSRMKISFAAGCIFGEIVTVAFSNLCKRTDLSVWANIPSPVAKDHGIGL